MTSKTRRKSALEFKRAAVALLESGGRPLTPACERIGHPALDAAGTAENDEGQARSPTAASAVGRGDDALWPIASGPRIAKRKTQARTGSDAH
jgi:hypothetical protein